jgi:hypothetical protein
LAVGHEIVEIYVRGKPLVNFPGDRSNKALTGGDQVLALDGGTRGYFSLAESGEDVVLQFTAVAVPEPSTVAMALAGLAYGGYSIWRRRKQA